MSNTKKIEQDLVRRVMVKLVSKHDKQQNPIVNTSEKIMAAYRNNSHIGIIPNMNKVFTQFDEEGLIRIDWHPTGAAIHRIRLKDADKVAQLFGIERHQDMLHTALTYLDNKLSKNDIYNAWRAEIMTCWKEQKRFIKFSISQYEQLADSILAAKALQVKRESNDITDEDIRHFSARVLNHSKMASKLIAGIVRCLYVLYPDMEDGLEDMEVLRLFGVDAIKHPIYVSGPIRLYTDNDRFYEIACDFPPAMGVWAENVADCIHMKTINTITSIENLASFYRYAIHRQGDELVIYTAGIPTPSFKRFYALLCRQFSEAELQHWGDIDVGGFTILSILEKVAGRNVSALNMDTDLYQHEQQYSKLNDKEKSRLQSIKLSSKNALLAMKAAQRGLKFEQESFV